MKRGLKFIIALILTCSIVMLIFLPICQVATVDMSIKDMILVAFNQPTGLEMLGTVGVLVQTYISPFGYALLGLVVLAALFVVLILISNRKKPYLLAIFGLFVLNGYSAALVYFLYDKFQSIAQAVLFYQLEGGVTLVWLSVILWIILNIVILVLSVVGLRLNGRALQTEKEILMPEAYPGSVEERLKEKPVIFQGVLLGKNGKYQGLAYPLQGMTSIFMNQDDQGIFLTTQKTKENLAVVRYDSTRQEYQLEVNDLHLVQLGSGQPLGARLYYLPRGIQIKFINTQETFILG